MKIGDILICKKEIWSFELNKPYIITVIGLSGNVNIVYLNSTNKINHHFAIDDDNHTFFIYLWNHFYTQDEIRLKKLESL